MKKRLPWIIIGLFALWILGALRAPRDKEGAWAVQDFGKLPVISNGRFQPLDSLARNSLAQLREKQDRKSTRLNSSHLKLSRMPSSA